MAPLLEVEDLAVRFETEAGSVRAVNEVSFEVEPGEVVAIVGESGSGKSVTVMTLIGLISSHRASFSGRANFDGLDLMAADERTLEQVRGRDIAMIFQDPMTALNPVLRIGEQIVEQIRAHEKVSAAAARERAVELLERVDIRDARERLDAYPHAFSGGMRQRVMIAMALSCGPRLLIADEPTTALDVTTQAQIIAELRGLADELGTAVILVTHDLGVVAQVADRVLVMYGGRVVERAGVAELFADPRHPYTWGLLGSIARMEGPRPHRLPSIPGAPPTPLALPAGCSFRPRCPHAFDRCLEEPPLASGPEGSAEHCDRCWLGLSEKRGRRNQDGRVGLVPDAGGIA
jgi:peptide/nickel transport system ATP-binding protein